MEDERCQVTVVGTRRRVDVALPANAPVGEYSAALLKWCGQADTLADTLPAAWSLARVDAAAFPQSASLAQSGVVDGEVLYLTDVLAGEFEEPQVTDLPEVVAQSGDAALWKARSRALAQILIALAMLVAVFVTAAVRTPGPEMAGLAVVAASVLAGFGWHATRRQWSLPAGVRIAAALTAAVLLGAAASCVPAAQEGAGALVVAVALGLFLGAGVARAAVRHAATSAVLAMVSVVLLVTVPLVALHAHRDQACAVAALVAAVALAAAPHTSGHLAAMGIAPQQLARMREGELDGVTALVASGRWVLFATSWLCAGVLGAVLLVLGGSVQVYTLAFTACLALGVLLAAGQLTYVAAVLPPVAAAVCALVELAVRLPGLLGAPWTAGPAVVAGAAVLLAAVALVRAFAPEGAGERPAWMDTVAFTLLLACVPLALGMFGTFGYLYSFGQGMR